MDRIGLACVTALACAASAVKAANAAVGAGAVGSGITSAIDYVLGILGVAAGGFVIYMAFRLMGGIAALGSVVLIAIGLLIALNPEDLGTVFVRR